MGPGGTAAASQLRNRHKGSTREVQGMYKGCTRDVQGMYKGYPRDTQGIPKGPARSQYATITLATRSPQACVSLNALTSRAGQLELRPANLRCICTVSGTAASRYDYEARNARARSAAAAGRWWRAPAGQPDRKSTRLN